MKKKQGLAKDTVSVASIVRQTLIARAAKSAAELEAQTKKKEAHDRIQNEVKEALPEIYKNQWLPVIQEAAANGEGHCFVFIRTYQGGYSKIDDRSYTMLSQGLALLREKGFNAIEIYDYVSRVGNEDKHGDRTTVSILISWEP